MTSPDPEIPEIGVVGQQPEHTVVAESEPDVASDPEHADVAESDDSVVTEPEPDVVSDPEPDVVSETEHNVVPDPQHAAVSEPEAPADSGFRVSLANFDGPFDLLLNLITKHELDITEVSLSAVTDEFLAYIRQADNADQMDEASEFLVVAVTLLDMKIAGLLPQGELVDAESVALLEARDLLFARLLQYRAFKEVAAWFQQHVEREDRRHTRSVRLDEKYRSRVPELVWTLNADDFAALALLAFTPKDIPSVGLDHLHAPLVSIREQAAIVVTMLRGSEQLTFRQLVAGAEGTGVVVARFLSILELYRHAAISFEQLEPLGELTLRWTAETWTEETLASLGADYDR